MRQKKSNIVIYVLLTILAAVWLIPIITVMFTSLKSSTDFYSGMGLFELPEKLLWSNYRNAWEQGRLALYIKNGLIVTCIKTPISVFISSLLAFALTRLNIRGSRAIFMFVLVGMMLPQQVALIPMNIIYSRLGLTNTYFCLILTYLGFGIPLATLVFRGFMTSIPKELDEAARIDGCSNWRLYWTVIMPLSKPAIASALIMDFLYTWNEFMIQSVLITTDKMKTVPNGLLSFFGEFTVDYGLLNAGVLISVVPVFIIYLLFQKFFVSGMAGAVKG